MPDEKPEWWAENERARERMGLPEYEPARFQDGTYVHEVTDAIAEEFDSTVRLIGVNTDYLEDWEVRIDGTTAFAVGRHRDERGNTVFETSADTFQQRATAWLDGREES